MLEPINHEIFVGGLLLTKNIFDSALDTPSLFLDKELLRHSYVPSELPHRDSEIESIRFNLVEALKGHIPSNMILYGVTGAGKTAVIRFICDQLVAKGEELGRVVNPLILNCRNIDTQYRVLAHLGNSLVEDFEEKIPFTGWPTDRVFGKLVKRMDAMGGVHVIVLDEIDHLVKKSGDDLLYNLTNLNADLNIARSCVIGISNDLTFTDYLDPRVRSRLGQEDVIFAPYKANHLVDILKKRSEVSISQGSIDKGVIELCSALAAQEHGDARKALDLLRVSTEKADQENSSLVSERHVRMAQNQIECDQITPVIATLPFQQKLVLYSVLINENNGLNNIATGEVYEIYKQACRFGGVNFLTQRRVTDLISNLDMLGLISAKTVSRARYGRSKEINSCIPVTIAASEIMRNADPGMIPVVKGKFRLQSRL